MRVNSFYKVELLFTATRVAVMLQRQCSNTATPIAVTLHRHCSKKSINTIYLP